MRLTVGPLPPAVYWRRRAVIGGALLLVVLALVYSCAPGGGGGGHGGGSAQGRTPAPNVTDSVPVFSPSPGTNLGGDVGGEAPPSAGAGDNGQTGGDQPAGANAAGTPDPAKSGPCTDDEMAMTAAPDPATAARGAVVRFTLRIRNTSSRACTRDVGADPQELYLQDASKTKIWSSDRCSPQQGSDVRTFQPGDVATFYVDWNGKVNNTGCGSDQQSPAAGTYQLIGRLASKLSPPGQLVLK